MITYKFKIQNQININEDYIRQFNNVIRFSYNRFKENPKAKLSDIEKIVKEKMNNIGMLDASIIKVAVNKAKGLIKKDKVIFGGKGNFIKRIKGLITKDEWKDLRNFPLMLRGSSSDNKGNRKAELKIVEDNCILIKLNRNEHFNVQLPRLNKKHKEQLSKLQLLCENKNGCFSLQINKDYIWISFEELIKQEKERKIVKDRVLSFDMNPNYIGVAIVDWKDQDNKEVIHKEIISFKELNDIDVRRLPSDKKKIKVNNKRRHEVFNVSKYIINLVKHFECEFLSFEKLNMKSSNKKKGKRFNRLVNNNWLRVPFVNNLKKRCNIEGIKFQEIVPEYSSFIGQINNPKEVDSIAAAMEISRRTYLFIKIYKQKTLSNQNIVFPKFNIGSLDDHWKKTLKDTLNSIKSWKQLYEWFKKSKTSYRFLFSKDKFFGNSFRLFSVKSKLYRYIFT